MTTIVNDKAADQVEQASLNTSDAPNKDLGDDAQRAFFESFASKDAAWVAEKDKQLVRRMDLRLLPFLIIMYLLNFLDRANLAQARQGSLEKDLGMTGTDFNLATSIFFVGYLLMQLPSNILITRVRPSIYLAVSVVLWGVVSTCNGAAKNFTHLVVIRFFLGFAEAPFFPGAIFLMSSWYTRAELTRRVAWFYTGNSLANMFGGLIAYGVLKDLNGAAGIAGWRWLFIIEGIATIAFGILSGFVLPDYPSTTRWLSEEDRAFASWRLLADISEADDPNNTSLWTGLKLALKDYRLYLFILLAHMSLLSQTFQYFFPSIVQTLGYDPLITLLLTVPAWFATFLTSVLVNWTAAKTKDKSLHIFSLMAMAAVGNAIATGTTATGPRFFAMFLMPMGSIASYTVIVGWVANSFPRPLVKRSASIAIVNMIGNCASIYGAYMYNKKDGPQYIPGGSANAVISFLVGSLAIGLRLVHKRENRKIEQAENEATANATGQTEAPLGFRYIY